jgi:hypothetical protein
MSQTTSREERRSALEEFTQRTVPEATEMVPVTHAAALPQVYGAQAVAVRRDERVVLNKISQLAAAAGSDWYYRFPVKNKKAGTTDWIEGPTIKLANDIARLYGNCEVDCRAEDFGSAYLFHARFVDLETGYATTRPFQQAKGRSRIGGADDSRRDDIDFQIGVSKATRNVIIQALSTFADFAFEEARNALVDKVGRDIETYRKRTVERIETLVPLVRAEAVIGRKAAEWLAPDIARVIAMGKAIADGMATADETFPPLHQEKPPQASQELKAALQASLDMVNTGASGAGFAPSSAGEAAVSTSTPNPPQEPGAAATDHPDGIKRDIIDRLIKVATDEKNPEAQARLETLDITEGMLLGEYTADFADFIAHAVRLAGKAVAGEITIDKAREYMGGLSIP